MAYTTYFIIRQIIMSVLLFMGLHMLFVPLKGQIKGSFYHKSLRTMGVAFLFVPVSCFLYTYQQQLDQHYMYAAISLTAYYATFVLMSMSFFVLLCKTFSKWLWAFCISTILIYPTPMWLSVISGDKELITTVMTATYSYFIIATILLVVCILYRHNKITRDIENFYSEDVQICVRWISKSIKMLLGLTLVCLVAPAFFVCPFWLRALFMTYGVLCYMHIYYGYRNMLVNLSEHFIVQYQTITIAEQKGEFDEVDDSVLSSEVMKNIQRKLEFWLLQKKYLKKGISIVDVAKDVNSNRTYVSKYINHVYKCSFKVWITSLRIEESKRIMESKPEVSINNIASSIGFASTESFTHIFTRIEKMPPTKWRELHTSQQNTAKNDTV